jgi:hypothetical protein
MGVSSLSVEEKQCCGAEEGECPNCGAEEGECPNCGAAEGEPDVVNSDREEGISIGSSQADGSNGVSPDDSEREGFESAEMLMKIALGPIATLLDQLGPIIALAGLGDKADEAVGLALDFGIYLILSERSPDELLRDAGDVLSDASN